MFNVSLGTPKRPRVNDAQLKTVLMRVSRIRKVARPHKNERVACVSTDFREYESGLITQGAIMRRHQRRIRFVTFVLTLKTPELGGLHAHQG
jgi:hypothetical protein